MFQSSDSDKGSCVQDLAQGVVRAWGLAPVPPICHLGCHLALAPFTPFANWVVAWRLRMDACIRVDAYRVLHKSDAYGALRRAPGLMLMGVLRKASSLARLLSNSSPCMWGLAQSLITRLASLGQFILRRALYGSGPGHV
jgi:hypothetical protein